MSFQWQVPAVLTRIAPGQLHCEWICRKETGEFYWSAGDPHYTFESVEELQEVHAIHRGVPLVKGPETPSSPRPKPKVTSSAAPAPSTSAPTPPREHWLIRWEREHED